jgi:hypothetical protein
VQTRRGSILDSPLAAPRAGDNSLGEPPGMVVGAIAVVVAVVGVTACPTCCVATGATGANCDPKKLPNIPVGNVVPPVCGWATAETLENEDIYHLL